MRIPLTHYGWPQVAIYPGIIGMIMILIGILGKNSIPLPYLLLSEGILFLVFLWALSFFRDPKRSIPSAPNLIVSPADGKITDVDILENSAELPGQVLRIGIFLSIFNVHINRAPCKTRFIKAVYKEGQYRNALNPESSQVNESNTIFLEQRTPPHDLIVVRQISGAIARHIVCRLTPEQELDCGEAFGMIKFGSRTELYVPIRENLKCLVSIGDKVQAGTSLLARYQS